MPLLQKPNLEEESKYALTYFLPTVRVSSGRGNSPKTYKLSPTNLYERKQEDFNNERKRKKVQIF